MWVDPPFKSHFKYWVNQYNFQSFFLNYSSVKNDSQISTLWIDHMLMNDTVFIFLISYLISIKAKFNLVWLVKFALTLFSLINFIKDFNWSRFLKLKWNCLLSFSQNVFESLWVSNHLLSKVLRVNRYLGIETSSTRPLHFYIRIRPDWCRFNQKQDTAYNV